MYVSLFSLYVGQCNNKECPFLHIDPEQKVKDCAWFDRGFCRHGMFFSGAVKNP